MSEMNEKVEEPQEQAAERPALRDVSPNELKEILEAHRKWEESEGKEGEGANLSVANLQEADLRGANLQNALLIGANLQKAILYGANLRGGRTDRGQPPGGRPERGQPPGGRPAQGQPPEGHPVRGQPPGGQPPGGQAERGRRTYRFSSREGQELEAGLLQRRLSQEVTPPARPQRAGQKEAGGTGKGKEGERQ